MRTQVTFDAADPNSLVRFWAMALGMEVEDHSDFVEQLVADGRIPVADRIMINRRSAFGDVAACRDPQVVEPRLFCDASGAPDSFRGFPWHDRQAAPCSLSKVYARTRQFFIISLCDGLAQPLF
jgi:hypothetical protein